MSFPVGSGRKDPVKRQPNLRQGATVGQKVFPSLYKLRIQRENGAERETRSTKPSAPKLQAYQILRQSQISKIRHEQMKGVSVSSQKPLELAP